MLKKEFEFILQDELIYSNEGRAGLIAKRLLLRAPNTKLLSLASKLSSIVMGALIKAREAYKDIKVKESKSSTSKDDDIDGAGIYMLVSGSIDSKQMGDFIDTFQELILSSNICLVDGKEPLTLDLFNSIDSRETLRLVGDYIANFLLPSITSNTKKKI